MITDSFFQQGVTHEVCEDYALHGPDYAIVTDGCSNGGGPRIDTDWGARILAKAAEQHMGCLTALDPAAFLECVGVTAKVQCGLFPNLPIECLTATLLVAHRVGETFFTIMIGDGVMGGRRRSGGWDIHIYDGLKGGKANCAAPFYLKYQLVEGDVDRYFDTFGGSFSHYFFRGDIKEQIATETKEEVIQLDSKFPYFFNTFPVSEYDIVFVGSDGAGSFYETINTGTSKHNDSRSTLDALGVLLDITNIRPSFLRIQRQWAWKRPIKGTFLGKNWHNSDDVSLAAIYAE